MADVEVTVAPQVVAVTVALPAPVEVTVAAGVPGPAGASGATTASGVSFTPTGNVAATDVQAAIAEVDTEKVPYNGTATYTDAASATTIASVSTVAAIAANTANFVQGMVNTVQVAATNTKNWTGATGLVGMQNAVKVLNGAAGVVSNATGLLSTVQASSASATITNAFGLRSIITTSAGGVITNAVTALLYGLGSATNNVGMRIATGSSIPTTPAGNFAVYDSTGYASYHAGRVGIGIDAPTQPLEVVGTAKADGFLSTNNAQTGTAYTLVLADVGKWITMTNASASTLTVPPNSSVAFPVGTTIEGSQEGAGVLTLTPGAGVTLNSAAGLTIDGQYGVFGMRKTGTDVWTVYGRTKV
jgi:hypothetical protein